MSSILKYQNPSSPLLTSNDSITDDNYNEKVREMYRLRAEADSLGTKYTKADSLGEKIAEYTLRKYMPLNGNALNYGYWAGTEKAGEPEDVDYLISHNIRIEDSDVVDFLQSYVNSEGFNRIRNNQINWWKSRHPYQKYLYPWALNDKKYINRYKNAINNYGDKMLNYTLDGNPSMSFSLPHRGSTFTYKHRFGDNKESPYFETQMHEFDHLFNVPASSLGTINSEVLDQNTNTKKNNHDEYRDEKHSDNLGIKYLLFKEGIYDARGNEDITPEQVQQLRNKYPKLRFLQQLNNEEAAFQINHVTQNITDPNRIDYKDPITFAKKGGRIHIKKKNRGKFTEYCGEKVTEECIAKGKKSKDPKIRKRATFAANARKWKHENGGILKAQEGTGNGFWSKLWNAVKAGGMAARDAKLGAVSAQQVRDLYSDGKNQEAQDLAKQYAKANTTGIALAGGAASTGLLGDLLVTGATTSADTFIDGDTENFGKNLSLNAAFDLVGHGAGKLLRNVDWGKSVIEESKPHWANTSKSKLSEAERLGIPKGQRSNPKALDNPQYWGYEQWNERYNKAIEEWDLDELQRLRDLHFITKAPGTQIITESGMPQRIYHFTHRNHRKGSGRPVRFFNKSSNDHPAPAYFTSSIDGDLTHDPGSIRSWYPFGQYVRGDYYLKMKNPLKEGPETHYFAGDIFSRKRGNTPKTLHRSQTMSESVLNSWRDKALQINEQMRKARRSGDKELFSKLQKQYHHIYDDILSPHVDRSLPTTNEKLYDLDKSNDFENLMKSELQSDGIIHNVGHTQHYITYDPEVIKSAEPVTYDDFDNIIPIVKRDNFRKADANYQQGGKL